MPTPPRRSQPSLDEAVQEFLKAEPPKKPAAPKPAPVTRHSVRVAAPGVTPPEEMGELRAAFSGVLKHEAEKASAQDLPTPLWRKLLAPVLLVLLASASAYVWLGNPGFLAPPPHTSLATPKTSLTGQRQLVAIALEIDDFRRSTGRLPHDLAELGLNAEFINYLPAPNLSYELRLGTGPHSLYYRGSADSEAKVQQGVAP
jgi:hypothetical protein